MNEVYLYADETLSAAQPSPTQQGLERYVTFYNQTRPHRAFDGRTSDGVYCDKPQGYTEGMEHSVQSSGATSLTHVDT